MANFQQQKQQEIAPIKLLSECFVKPMYESEVAKQPYHLGPVDLAMLNLDPIQKGLLYTFNHDTEIVLHLLEKLKRSLSIALVHFYPLAGRFSMQKYVEENACSIYVDCNKGPGARLIHATALDLTVSDIISSTDATIVRPFFDLGEKSVNYDGHTKALVSIQVTELLDGAFIGFSMSHSVGDGTSFIHFVNMLSEIFRSNDNAIENKITHISRGPIFNYRPWLAFNSSSDDVAVLKLPFLDVEKFIYRGYDPSPIRERIFHFSSTSMAKLKAKANEECGTTYNVISSFQALIAFIWRSITRVRNLPLDQQTTCFFPVGVRSRLDPPISDDYFGNFISRAQCTCNVEELLGHDLGWVAMNLQNHIMAQDGNVVLDRLKKLASSPIVVPRGNAPNPLGMNGVIIAGSARFDMFGSEFELGRVLAVRMGYGNKEDGKITVNQGCEGVGSVDLDICLKPHIMAALEADEEFMSFVSS